MSAFSNFGGSSGPPVLKHDAKLVILGSAGVGKTCLGLRFVKDQFVTYTASTIGASFLLKELPIGNHKVTLQIWDTAGQERFRAMAPLYYRGAVAAIFVFSITDERSFEKLKEWVRLTCSAPVPSHRMSCPPPSQQSFREAPQFVAAVWWSP